MKHESEMNFTCTICGRVSKSALAFTRHQNKCKVENMNCTLCDKVFDSNTQFKQHIVDVHKDKLFVCSNGKCFATYTTKKGLMYHESTNHVVKLFTCVPCEENFSTADEFSTHKRSKEHKAQIAKTVCTGCGRTFRSNHESSRHFENSCPFNPMRPVKCFICRTESGQACDFLEHLKEKHNSKSKYLCTRCLLDLPTKTKLESHLQTCKLD